MKLKGVSVSRRPILQLTMANPLHATILLLAVGLAFPIRSLGRPVSHPAVDELWAKADLVAVIRPLATTNVSDSLTSAGPNYGPRDPKDYQALNTRCEVSLLLKASEKLAGWRTNELTILHFRYAPDVPEFNGGMFMYFDVTPKPTHLIVEGDPGHPIAWGTRTYLAFLKAAPDGRFHAVTGHYDSETSFRVLATPVGGALRYVLEDVNSNRAPREGEAPNTGPVSGLSGSVADAQRFETPAGGPFLEMRELNERVATKVDEVLTKHGFLTPSIVTRGAGGVIWFVSERPLPKGKTEGFDRLYLGVTPEYRVTNWVTGYVRGPSAWGLRGSRFGNAKPEAETIAGELESALRR